MPIIVAVSSAPGKEKGKEVTGMRRFRAVIGMAGVIVVMMAGSSVFGMMSSWQEARKVCEERLAKEGKQEDTEALQKCCDNMILVADINPSSAVIS